MLPPNPDELDAYKDYAQIRDHTTGPATTVLTAHVGRPGPFMKRRVPIYKEKTGRDAYEDYPGY